MTAPTPNYGALEARLRADEDAMRAEDESLAAMEAGVGRTKQIAGAIKTEVDEQNALIDDIEAGMGRTQERTAKMARRTANLERDPHTIRNFCSLLVPLTLLIVIALFWLRHWLLGV